jgi:alpha-L-fucosidase
MLATGEWTMTNKDLNYKEYAKLAGGFYPSKFDAAKWVPRVLMKATLLLLLLKE